MGKSTAGQRVALLRERLGLTIQQFATEAELTVATLYRIENGDVSPRTSNLKKMAGIFGVPEEWMIHGKGELTVDRRSSRFEDSPLYKEMKERIAYLEKLVDKLTRK